MARVSLRQFNQKTVVVKNLIDDVCNALPDNENAEMLRNNFDELWSMIIDVSEALDGVISDIEK